MRSKSQFKCGTEVSWSGLQLRHSVVGPAAGDSTLAVLVSSSIGYSRVSVASSLLDFAAYLLETFDEKVLSPATDSRLACPCARLPE